MISARARRWLRIALCAAALGWCSLLLLAHWWFGALACSFEGSACAASRHKDGTYQGILRDREGKRLPDTDFLVAFESRRHEHQRAAGGFGTDAAGRYCVVWAQEGGLPSLYLGGAYLGPIQEPWTPLDGADPPAGCQSGDVGIPWNRADDLQSSPQYLSVGGLGLGAMVLLVLGFAPAARRARLAGAGATLATTVLAMGVWFL